MCLTDWMQQYYYRADLLSLDFCWPESTVGSEKRSVVRTPLQLSVWEDSLRFHPDRAFARYILRGIRECFRVGFDRRSPLKSAARNLPQEHPEVIQQYLEKDGSLGRMLGPFTQTLLTSTLPHQSVWGDPERGEHGQVASHYQPLLPTRRECE